MSERMIGNNFHEKVKRKPLSEETKKKIREKLLGRKLPDEVKEKISASSKIIAQKRRRNEDGKFV